MARFVHLRNCDEASSREPVRHAMLVGQDVDPHASGQSRIAEINLATLDGYTTTQASRKSPQLQAPRARLL